MTHRWIRMATVAVALGVATWALLEFGFGREREWSTRSKEALAAYQEGLDSRMRFYENDAAASFRRAVELDPQFAAAKFQLSHVSRLPEERKQLLADLEATDLARLTPRERFLVESALAGRDDEKLDRITTRALVELPDDPWVLFFAGARAWESENWQEADRLYRALLEVDPNWVTAHNHLGYLAMSRSRFGQAEEHFRTYTYVAPDQANPHDSLGELLSLVGRYDEARAEIELALAERPDFCASYLNLLGIATFEGRSDGSEAVLERVRKSCPERFAQELECEFDLVAAMLERDFDRPWREGFVACTGKPGERGVLVHRLALLSGRLGEADAEEAGLSARLASPEPEYRIRGKGRREEIELRHEEGVRALLAGHPLEAAAKFREADEKSFYWGAEEGRLKLFNLLHLVIALERANDAAGAQAALAAARAVNPAFAAHLPEIAADLVPAS